MKGRPIKLFLVYVNVHFTQTADGCAQSHGWTQLNLVLELCQRLDSKRYCKKNPPFPLSVPQRRHPLPPGSNWASGGTGGISLNDVAIKHSWCVTVPRVAQTAIQYCVCRRCYLVRQSARCCRTSSALPPRSKAALTPRPGKHVKEHPRPPVCICRDAVEDVEPCISSF